MFLMSKSADGKRAVRFHADGRTDGARLTWRHFGSFGELPVLDAGHQSALIVHRAPSSRRRPPFTAFRHDDGAGPAEDAPAGGDARLGGTAAPRLQQSWRRRDFPFFLHHKTVHYACAEAFYRRLLVLLVSVGAAAASPLLGQQQRLQARDHHRQEGFGTERRRGRQHDGRPLIFVMFLGAGALGLAEEDVVVASVTGARGSDVDVAVGERRVGGVSVGLVGGL